MAELGCTIARALRPLSVPSARRLIGMRFGIVHPNLGQYGDPRTVSRLARTAEQAGWDGLFVWDHLGFVWDGPAGDPWILLAAAAAATERIRLGTAVTPLPRRRPQIVAMTVTTLDRQTNGRIVLGVGLGGVRDANREFTAFGDAGSARVRSEMLDEALEVVTALWSGERVDFRGRHYVAEGVTFKPVPVQRPRVPIWVGGESAPAIRRAARWDGWIAPVVISLADQGDGPAQEIAKKVQALRALRSPAAAFEVAVQGQSEPGDGALVRSYEQAGVTWWLECVHGRRGTWEEMLDRVSVGPPDF